MRVLALLLLPTATLADTLTLSLQGLTLTVPLSPWAQTTAAPPRIEEGTTENGTRFSTVTWTPPVGQADETWRLTLESPTDTSLSDALTDFAAPYLWSCTATETQIATQAPDRLTAVVTCTRPDTRHATTHVTILRSGDGLATLAHSHVPEAAPDSPEQAARVAAAFDSLTLTED